MQHASPVMLFVSRLVQKAVLEREEVPASSNGSSSPRAPQLTLRIGAKVIPHPAKVDYGGEDAFFISSVGGGAFGVADGVGGWQESGINPAEYSRTFMRLAHAYLEGRDVAPLSRATRTVSAANLGDSGFLLVRDGRPFFKSPVLQHHFDCPYQFGACPEFTGASDYAEDAAAFELPVQPGDVIVVGTDGLWDNVPEQDVLPLLPDAGEGALQSAGAIAALAAQRGADPGYESPYSREALRQGLDLAWWQKLAGASLRDGRLELGSLRGGKMDDVTVLVAIVVEEDPPPEPASIDPAPDTESTALADVCVTPAIAIPDTARAVPLPFLFVVLLEMKNSLAQGLEGEELRSVVGMLCSAERACGQADGGAEGSRAEADESVVFEIEVEIAGRELPSTADATAAVGSHAAEEPPADTDLLPAFVKSFVMIIVTEVGDETFIIAAIMAMRHPRVVVYAGAMTALIFMTIISTALGYVLPNLISRKATHHAASVLYTIFGVRLLWIAWRSKPQESNQEEVEEVEAKLTEAEHSHSAVRAFFAQFCTPVFLEALILTFLGEWGDRSQIATITLAAVYNPVGVTAGAIFGHLLCTGTAVVGGQLLAMRISQRTVAISGGVMFLLFAVNSVLTSAE
ncbi:hypothetical protein WJX81_000872 [Elliptochloris bilobata]|uniref:PPM-type phosphatase domain-containing protein n=1 Tax=Elliptochloris bilobata TaxID=381761 RepID=A0AAW1R0K7_9CHLO